MVGQAVEVDVAASVMHAQAANLMGKFECIETLVSLHWVATACEDGTCTLGNVCSGALRPTLLPHRDVWGPVQQAKYRLLCSSCWCQLESHTHTPMYCCACRTCLAVAGADYCIVGASTRMSTGYSILTRRSSKILQL